MERLTKVINACGKTVVVYTRGKYEDTTTGEMRHEDIRNVMRRLSDYEDTGLTPEQIRELKERDTAKAPIKDTDSGVRYTDDYICPNCGRHFTGTGIAAFCYRCGQRLKWEE